MHVAAPFSTPSTPIARAHAAAAAPPTQLTVASYNVHNLYDTDDDPQRNDDVHTAPVYALGLAKTAAAIVAMGTPDIIGLQEVENQHVLDDLLKQPALRDAGYAAKYIPGNDMWSHDDAFLYRTSTVKLDKLTVTNPVMKINDGPKTVDPTLLFSTPPATGEFSAVGDAANGARITVIVNHMKSKIGGAANDERRMAQGNFIGSLVDAHVKAEPSVPVAVIGDLNSGGTDKQFQAILHRADGSTRMIDTSDKLPANDRFSYNYHGQLDQLDHVLISAPHADTVVGAKIMHFNSKGDRSQMSNPNTEVCASDHDPTMATFKLG